MISFRHLVEFEFLLLLLWLWFSFVFFYHKNRNEADFVQRLLNMYSYPRVCFLVLPSLWSYFCFPDLGKLKVCNSACHEEKEFFLVSTV